jgi:hypothetical protein
MVGDTNRGNVDWQLRATFPIEQYPTCVGHIMNCGRPAIAFDPANRRAVLAHSVATEDGLGARIMVRWTSSQLGDTDFGEVWTSQLIPQPRASRLQFFPDLAASDRGALAVGFYEATFDAAGEQTVRAVASASVRDYGGRRVWSAPIEVGNPFVPRRPAAARERILGDYLGLTAVPTGSFGTPSINAMLTNPSTTISGHLASQAATSLDVFASFCMAWTEDEDRMIAPPHTITVGGFTVAGPNATAVAFSDLWMP